MHRVLRALWSLFWTLLFLAIVGVTVASLYNVARDDFDVEQRAEAEACGGEGKGCNLQPIYVERGPISETFEFYDARPDRQEKIRVRCTHEHVFVGADACEVRDRRPYMGARVALPPRPTTKARDGGVRQPTAPAPVPTGTRTAAPMAERDGGL